MSAVSISGRQAQVPQSFPSGRSQNYTVLNLVRFAPSQGQRPRTPGLSSSPQAQKHRRLCRAMAYYLGMDFGTSGARATVIDGELYQHDSPSIATRIHGVPNPVHCRGSEPQSPHTNVTQCICGNSNCFVFICSLRAHPAIIVFRPWAVQRDNIRDGAKLMISKPTADMVPSRML